MSVRFERPASLAEATRLLAAGGWHVLAGGTDIYPAHVGRSIPRPLLDITAIGELRGIRRTATGWSIGAATTWSDVLQSNLPPHFDALKQAAREVGGIQIQNTGTVAGNLCNASPAADGTPVLLALDASVVLRSAAAERRVTVDAFVLGNRSTACRPDELVVSIEVPARSPRARSVFTKLGGRSYLTISMTMVAVAVDFDEAGAVDPARVAVGSCAARATRLPTLEARLVGANRSAGLASRVESSDLVALAPIDDLRASARYRLDATLTLLRRALTELER